MRMEWPPASEAEIEYFYHPRPRAQYRINFGRPGGPADRVHEAIDLAAALKALKAA